jgi:putative membrane protein
MTYHGRILGSALLVLSFAALGASAQETPRQPQAPGQLQPGQQGQQPQQFVPKAVAAGLYEVQAAEMAVDRTQSVTVRQFAEQMLGEHKRMNQELVLLANQRQWIMPKEPDASQKQMLERLAKMEGAAFDREFAEQQLRAHQEAVALFQQQADTGTDQTLSGWANKKLDMLRTHLYEAERLARAS